MVAALRDGTVAALRDPDAAIDRIVRASGADRELVSAQFDAISPALRPALRLDRPALEDWASFDAEFGILEEAPEVDEAFALRYAQRSRLLAVARRRVIAPPRVARRIRPGARSPQRRCHPVEARHVTLGLAARPRVENGLGRPLGRRDQPAGEGAPELLAGKPSVAMKPGSTIPTCTPCALSSWWSASVHPVSANLLAE